MSSFHKRKKPLFIWSMAILAIGLSVSILSVGCSGGGEAAEKSASAPTAASPRAPATSPTATPGSTSAPPQTKPINGLVQSNSGGSVTIKVEWLGVQNDLVKFKVAMDTHSVDLDDIDLGKLAVIVDDSGSEVQPSAWEAKAGGHHREGTLQFRAPASLVNGETKQVSMQIRNVSGVAERSFRWNLTP